VRAVYEYAVQHGLKRKLLHLPSGFIYYVQVKHMAITVLNNPQRQREMFADLVIFTILPAEVNQFLQRDFNSIIVDVRETEDFIDGHVPGAIHLPKGNWGKISEWPNVRTVIVYGRSSRCPVPVQAMLEFANQGYPVIEMEGGFEAWEKNQLLVAK
jgi:rhodanese-related sulfurtransferase